MYPVLFHDKIISFFPFWFGMVLLYGALRHTLKHTYTDSLMLAILGWIHIEVTNEKSKVSIESGLFLHALVL